MEPGKRCARLCCYTKETDHKKPVGLRKRYWGAMHIYPGGQISYNKKATLTLKIAKKTRVSQRAVLEIR